MPPKKQPNLPDRGYSKHPFPGWSLGPYPVNKLRQGTFGIEALSIQIAARGSSILLVGALDVVVPFRDWEILGAWKLYVDGEKYGTKFGDKAWDFGLEFGCLWTLQLKMFCIIQSLGGLAAHPSFALSVARRIQQGAHPPPLPRAALHPVQAVSRGWDGP